MLLVVLGVAFVYCGGSNVPAVLRNNKQLLGGVVVGLFLCSFFGLRLEGFDMNERFRTCRPLSRPMERERNLLDQCKAQKVNSDGKAQCSPKSIKIHKDNFEIARKEYMDCLYS